MQIVVSDFTSVISQLKNRKYQLIRLRDRCLITREIFYDLTLFIDKLINYLFNSEFTHLKQFLRKMRFRIEQIQNRNLTSYMMQHGHNVSKQEMQGIIQYYAELSYMYQYLWESHRQCLKTMMLGMPMLSFNPVGKYCYADQFATFKLDWYFELPF